MQTYTPARAVLTSGSAHDDVHLLGRLLAGHGYDNTVSRGENPFGVVDESILAAVNAYRHANDVAEEADVPGVPPGERRQWIGPELWAALLGELEAEAETDAQREARELAEAEAAERAEVEAEVRAEAERRLAERRAAAAGNGWSR